MNWNGKDNEAEAEEDKNEEWETYGVSNWMWGLPIFDVGQGIKCLIDKKCYWSWSWKSF